MYDFIKTDEQPFLKEMTTCYEVLCVAVERARAASELALNIREQFAVEFSRAIQRRTEKLTGKQVKNEDENAEAVATLVRVSGAKEQAAKLPLLEAIKDTRSLLGRLDGIDRTTWRPWQKDAFEINTICLVQTLKKALVVFEKIFPEPLRSSRVKLYRDYVRACEFAHFMPFLPHAVASNIGACELLIRCLLDANRGGRKYYVPLLVADDQAVSLAEHYLRQAGWKVKVVVKDISEWIRTGKFEYSDRRFQLIPPARFSIELNMSPAIRAEG